MLVLWGDRHAAQAQDDAALRSLRELYKRPPPARVENAALVDLGRLLFWDPRVSASATGSIRFPKNRRKRIALCNLLPMFHLGQIVSGPSNGTELVAKPLGIDV